MLAGACAAPPATSVPKIAAQPFATTVSIAENVTSTPTASIITITFSKDKCAIEGPKSIPAGKNTITLIGDSRAHDGYGVSITTWD